MNRLAFGAGVLVLAPVLSGCSNFYLVNPPPPAPTATPAPTAIAFPFDPEQGKNAKTATGGLGIPQNGPAGSGLPTAFRVGDVQDIQFGLGRANDSANAMLFLVLQPVSPAATVTTTTTTTTTTPPGGPSTAPAATTTSTTLIAGPKNINHPVHLAGIIVPGPNGRVGAGLQDPDEQALQAIASSRMVEAVSRWVRLTGTYAPTVVTAGATATPIATPTATPRPRPGVTRATPIPTPPPLVDPAQLLDVYQDPQFPVDSQNRPLVQILFTSTGGNSIPAGTKLSLNRMLVRSGWAVVDLYSPTSFDQQTWLLDEAYARHRHLGMWGLELNGKKFVLQQRVPSPSTGTGARSHVSVTNNVPLHPNAPITSATQSPLTLTPTIPPTIPRVVPHSGTSVARGPANRAILPPSSQGAASAPATAAGAGPGGTSNMASGPG